MENPESNETKEVDSLEQDRLNGPKASQVFLRHLQVNHAFLAYAHQMRVRSSSVLRKGVDPKGCFHLQTMRLKQNEHHSMPSLLIQLAKVYEKDKINNFLVASSSGLNVSCKKEEGAIIHRWCTLNFNEMEKNEQHLVVLYRKFEFLFPDHPYARCQTLGSFHGLLKQPIIESKDPSIICFEFLPMWPVEWTMGKRDIPYASEDETPEQKRSRLEWARYHTREYMLLGWNHEGLYLWKLTNQNLDEVETELAYYDYDMNSITVTGQIILVDTFSWNDEEFGHTESHEDPSFVPNLTRPPTSEDEESQMPRIEEVD